MKKSIVLKVFAAVVLLNATLVFAQLGQEDFYNTCINKRIAECQIKASLEDTQSPNLLHLAEINRDQAAFYKDNREELIKQMLAAHLETKAHAVDHFLIKTFFAEYPSTLPSSQ